MASASAATTATVGPATPVAVKVAFGGEYRRFRIPLGELGPVTFPTKVSLFYCYLFSMLVVTPFPLLCPALLCSAPISEGVVLRSLAVLRKRGIIHLSAYLPTRALMSRWSFRASHLQT